MDEMIKKIRDIHDAFIDDDNVYEYIDNYKKFKKSYKNGKIKTNSKLYKEHENNDYTIYYVSYGGGDIGSDMNCSYDGKN